ncbi:MAG: pyridoxal phosphate-dependent aminotransferase [Bacteroidetes bacterium]|nr:pyridoxal phosphate-dependent aminotransferase [Bacteroidota bacterium]
MEISKLAASIAESPTVKLNAEAIKLRAQGEAIVHLGVGEPKNKAPQNAVARAVEKLNSGEIKYAPADGMPSLKKAIVQYTEKNYGRTVDAANIIVSDGAKHSLFNLLYALINPGDQVIILAPYWVSYPEMVKMMNGVPVIVKPSDGSFCPSISDIEKAITESTRAIILNSPNNPSGAVFPDELVAKIVDLCEKKNIYFFSDDIYHKLVFDGRMITPVYSFTKKDIESTNVVVINGLSKTYGMTGFRIGWVVGSRQLVKVMTNIQSQSTTCNSPICQVAAEAALTGDQSCVNELVAAMQANRDMVVKELKLIPGVKVAKPEGTFYCLPDFSAINKDSMVLAEFLLKKALVITVPGREFGAEGHLRISYAGAAAEVAEGMARIKWALDPNSPREMQIGNKKVVRDW